MSPRKTLAIGLIFIALLMIMGVLILLEPEWLISTLKKRSPEVLYEIDTQEYIVALTIDDGPDPDTTPDILDRLKQYGAHATFFLIGDRIPDNEDLIHRIVEENHELANHLMTDQSSIRLNLGDFEQQLAKSHAILSEFSEPRWFRPGSGWYNSDMLSIIQKYDYQCALGSVYPFDPQLGSSWFTTRYVLWKVKPGSIIVLHDFDTRGERTAVALDTILPELTRRGYSVVTLSELVDSQSNGE
jgi:peptidoglycan/xylan/chitin deacetylase (PgdA/CDA1 family)